MRNSLKIEVFGDGRDLPGAHFENSIPAGAANTNASLSCEAFSFRAVCLMRAAFSGGRLFSRWRVKHLLALRI